MPTAASGPRNFHWSVGVSPPVVTFMPLSRDFRMASEVTSPLSDSTISLKAVYAIQVVCTPASAASMRLSPKASSLMTFFIGFQRESVSTGYQPVMYDPS